jgi:tetratricopeptide (TPR) repeat protein
MKIFISIIINILFFVGLAYSQFIDEAEYYTHLGLSCYQVTNYKEALEHFKKALELKPKSTEIKKALAATYFQLATKSYKK